MHKVLATFAADVVRFSFAGVVALAAGVVDAATGQHLGGALDTTLVVAGLAALGLHVKDSAGL